MGRTSSQRGKEWRNLNRAEDRWAENLKDLCSKSASACRRRGKNVECRITAEEIRQLGERQGFRCYWTGIKFRLIGKESHPLYPSVDRIEAGGNYELSNCRLSCWFVNRARGDSPGSEFIRYLHDTVMSFGSAPAFREYHTLFEVKPVATLDTPES